MTDDTTPEVTSEVIMPHSFPKEPVDKTAPKRRGRPKKFDLPVTETPTPAPLKAESVTVVLPEPPVERLPAASQSMTAQALAEMEAGRRTLAKYRRG